MYDKYDNIKCFHEDHASVNSKLPTVLFHSNKFTDESLPDILFWEGTVMGPKHKASAALPYIVHFQTCKRANSRDRSVTIVDRFEMPMGVKVPTILEDVTQ